MKLCHVISTSSATIVSWNQTKHGPGPVNAEKKTVGEMPGVWSSYRTVKEPIRIPATIFRKAIYINKW